MVLQSVVVFAAGALVVVAAAAAMRAGLWAALERQGHRLDRWRRPWCEPERESSALLEALLIVAYVRNFAGLFGLPLWATLVLAGVWALHLPADAWSWVRLHRRPHGTRELHERGFFLLDTGPLWVRLVSALAAGAAYFFVSPLRRALDTIMGYGLGLLRGWLN